MKDDQVITTKILLEILNRLYRKDFKYSKLVYYIRQGLFPFIKTKVGEGYVREFSTYDVIAIVCTIEIYQEFKEKNLMIPKAAQFIRNEIENPKVFEHGVAIVGGIAGSLTMTEGYDDFLKALKREFDEEGIKGAGILEGGAVSRRSDGIPRFQPFFILPVYKVARAVMKVLEGE